MHQLIRVAKLAIAGTLVSVVAYAIYDKLLLTTSTAAVVGAVAFTLRAPISGTVKGDLIAPGDIVDANEAVWSIHNAWLPKAELYQARLRATLASDGAATSKRRKDDLAKLATRLEQREREYRATVSRQLAMELSQAEKEFSIAATNRAHVEQELRRAEELEQSGLMERRGLDEAKLRRDLAIQREQIAHEEVSAARERVVAGKQGISLGLGLQERPYSAQRLDEIEMSTSHIDREAQRLDAETVALADVVRHAEDDLRRLETTEVRAGGRARVWKPMATPGEYVRTGEPLAQLASCDRVVVAAWVSKRNFLRIQPGQRARLKLRDGETFNGKVVLPVGIADYRFRDSFAFPEMDDGEGDRLVVVLEFPTLASKLRTECSLGLTGDVVFE